jgi:hypothetical protein
MYLKMNELLGSKYGCHRDGYGWNAANEDAEAGGRRVGGGDEPNDSGHILQTRIYIVTIAKLIANGHAVDCADGQLLQLTIANGQLLLIDYCELPILQLTIAYMALYLPSLCIAMSPE